MVVTFFSRICIAGYWLRNENPRGYRNTMLPCSCPILQLQFQLQLSLLGLPFHSKSLETNPTTNMLTNIPEGPGNDDAVITPNTPTEQPSNVLPEHKSSHQPSHHNAYPPPHQPMHQDTVDPTHQPKKYQDILAYEDKWIGWDGPVWCSRYGRFENREDAAADDGYKSVGQVHHQGMSMLRSTRRPVPMHRGQLRIWLLDLGLERCEKHGCNCRLPFQHRSYVKDIQRRVEPMVESLIRLESQVGKLIHHAIKDGESALHHNGQDGSKHEAIGAPPDGHRGRRPSEPIESLHEAAYRQRYDEAPHPGHTQRPREPVETSVEKLEDRVENLMKQVQHMMKDGQDRFEKYGENIVPPSQEERGEVRESHQQSWNDGREYYQGGR